MNISPRNFRKMSEINRRRGQMTLSIGQATKKITILMAGPEEILLILKEDGRVMKW